MANREESTAILDEIHTDSNSEESITALSETLASLDEILGSYVVDSQHDVVGYEDVVMVPADDEVMACDVKRVSVEEYFSAISNADRDEPCSVCVEAKEDVMCLLPCNHGFHESCIGKWFKINHFCPLCRFEFRSQLPQVPN